MVSEKRYVVLDTWVLAKVSTFPKDAGESDEVWKAMDLLSKIIYKCHRVVLDDKGEILEEYNRHKKSEFARHWLILICKRANKVEWVTRAALKINKPLDPDDVKFVEVAVGSPHRLIVTGNSDLLNIKDNEEIKSYRLKILDVNEALQEL